MKWQEPQSLQASSLVDWRTPSVHLADVVISPSTRQEVWQFVEEWRARDLFAKHDLPIRRTILLTGPTGNGKTTLAGAIALALGLSFGVVQYASVIDQYVGNSGKNVASVLSEAGRRTCVLMFDEADSLATARQSGARDGSREMNNCTNILLTGLDGLRNESVVILATNMGDDLDSAVRRRMAVRIDLPSPTIAEREAMESLMERRWPYIRKSGWRRKAAECGSLAEIEQAALSAAREIVLEKHRAAQRASSISKALLGE